MINVISWIVFGLVIGAIARLLVPGRDPIGWIATIVLGIIGSLAGGFLGNLLMGRPFDEMNPAGWILSIIGAVVLLLLYRKFARGPART